MRAVLATTIVLALVAFGPRTAGAQMPPEELLEDEPDEAAPPPPPVAPRRRLPPPAPLPPPLPVRTIVVVQCEAPPCPAAPAPAAPPVPAAPTGGGLPRSAFDANYRKVYKLGLGLEIMGPAYTLGLAAHWNVSSMFGLSATFGFVGPQVVTLQARLMPIDGKWTPYVAGGVSFLLNPGWTGSSSNDCLARSDWGGTADCSSSTAKGDSFIFKGTNVVPSAEVGVMVLTHRGFSAQLGFTFYINPSYQDHLGVITVPWPKVGLAWYF
jgi:hypothetical protein